MEYEFTTGNFEAEVLSSEKPVMVDFFAQWCGPCKMMGPLVEQLAEEYADQIKIGKLDIDENMETAQKYRVMSVPTFAFFKDGQLEHTVVGAVSRTELENTIKRITE